MKWITRKNVKVDREASPWLIKHFVDPEAQGIEVTAMHSHMLTEQPRLFFMHFWANDDVVRLATGLRAALDRTNSLRGNTK